MPSVEDYEQAVAGNTQVKEQMGPVVKGITSAIENALQGVANFFGAAPVIKNFIRSLGGSLPTSAEVQALINKIVAEKKVDASQVLERISSALNSIRGGLSQNEKKALSNLQYQLKSKLSKVRRTVARAENAEQVAGQLAYELDNDITSQALDKANNALDMAKKAAESYEQAITEN